MKPLQIMRTSPNHDELIELFKKEENLRLKERYQALYLLCEGNNCTEVGKIIKRSRRTILNWLHAFNKGGLDAIVPILPPGRIPSLTQEQKAKLQDDVSTHPRELGYEFSNWEAKSVAFHIDKKFNVELSTRQANRLLHELGFTLQRPRYRFKKADPKQKEEFIQQFQKKWTLSTHMM